MHLTRMAPNAALHKKEIMEELNAPDIEYEKDGSVILYYKNQSIDITQQIQQR